MKYKSLRHVSNIIIIQSFNCLNICSFLFKFLIVNVKYLGSLYFHNNMLIITKQCFLSILNVI